MDANTVAAEIAEEIRTNGALRHRLGMVEGSETASGEDSPEIFMATETGEAFRLKVEEA